MFTHADLSICVANLKITEMQTIINARINAQTALFRREENTVSVAVLNTNILLLPMCSGFISRHFFVCEAIGVAVCILGVFFAACHFDPEVSG